MKNEEMKKWLTLILFAIVSYWTINNLNLVFNLFGRIIKILLPFILGGVLAFILNIPMKKIEKILSKHFKIRKNIIRVISIFFAMLLLILIISFVLFLLIPELINNIQVLLNNIPQLIDKIEIWIIDLLDKYPDIQNQISDIFNQNNIGNIVSNVLNHLINGAVVFITSLVNGIVTLFTAIIFAIYILSQKEYLNRGFKKIIKAYMKEKYANKIFNIGSLANKTFSKFISGQCVEALILGLIFFIVLSIFKFPFALLISVLTSITALIPIFGAMIAMCIGAVLIAINNPIQALLFIVIFQIIQQIEGNFIYPKIVGKSVGLSPMWTLLAISVGGSLYGIVGMLIGLPLASIIYALIKEDVNKRLEQKI